MTTDIGFCNLEDSLTAAAEIMWQKDCGVVPVIGEKQKVVGMITDRDICIAAATRNQKTSDIKAGEMLRGEVVSCAPTDDIETALKKMRKFQLKRLPVLTETGELAGVLSMADILLLAKKDKELKKKIYSTLKAIGTPRPILLKEISRNAELLLAD